MNGPSITLRFPPEYFTRQPFPDGCGPAASSNIAAFDPAISELNTVNYYDEVASKLGAEETKAFTRLYIPGMRHCTFGPGPDSFGQLGSGGNDAQHNAELANSGWKKALRRTRSSRRSTLGTARQKT